MDFTKRDLKGRKWQAHNRVGEALAGKLIEQITPIFCPAEVTQVLDEIVEELHTEAFWEAVRQVHDDLLVNKFKGE